MVGNSNPGAPSRGPLDGVRVLEIAGIGPVPFCGMLLADMGAEILRIDRPDPGLRSERNPRHDLLSRGRRSAAVDMKRADGADLVRALAGRADVLLEGFRPGVMERLGLGPDSLHADNPRLVYGRMTGWGQDGPLAPRAGHDLNYIALSGALHAMGSADEPPPVPLNLIGDFGGGAMYLAFGVMCALFDAARTGRGQVVDAAMVDGSLSLMTMFFGMRAMGLWQDARGENFLDGSAPFYGVYRTADDGYVALGAIEPAFWAELLRRLELDDIDPGRQRDRRTWAHTRARLTETFARRPRDAWAALLEDCDACLSPVLAIGELADHRHHRARGALVEAFGVLQPAPAPRLSATPARIALPPPRPGEHTRDALLDWGMPASQVDEMLAQGTIGWRGPPWPAT